MLARLLAVLAEKERLDFLRPRPSPSAHLPSAAVRVTFATSSGPPPVQLLEAEQDAEGRPCGAMLMVEGWQALLGQTSSSSQPPPQQQRKQGQRSPTELAPFCIEVSDWRRLHEEEEKEDTRGIGDAKRRRVEAAGGTSSKPPRPVYTEVCLRPYQHTLTQHTYRYT